MSLDADFSTAASDQIEAVLCARLEAIRLSRNLTQAALAREAGVSRRTIVRLAAGQGTTLDTFIRVLTALGLQQHLETLLPDPAVRPMERAAGPGHERRRARPQRTDAPASEWTWADDTEDDGHE